MRAGDVVVTPRSVELAAADDEEPACERRWRRTRIAHPALPPTKVMPNARAPVRTSALLKNAPALPEDRRGTPSLAQIQDVLDANAQERLHLAYSCPFVLCRCRYEAAHSVLLHLERVHGACFREDGTHSEPAPELQHGVAHPPLAAIAAAIAQSSSALRALLHDPDPTYAQVAATPKKRQWADELMADDL